MVYLHVTVEIKPGKIREFHKLWVAKSLPLWEKHGAKHIGSFNTYIGTNNQIIRLFAFENLTKMEEFHTALYKSDEGRQLLEDLNDYVVAGHSEIVTPAFYSPLK